MYSTSDTQSLATDEFACYLERQGSAIAPQLPNPIQEPLEGIRVVLRDIAYKTALDVRRLSEETVRLALQMGQWL